MPRPAPNAADLAARLLDGDKRALARAISLVENDDPEGWALVREVFPHTGRASVVGFTGPPGVGKSTLIGRLVEHARARERDVAVLSIDPSSPFTKGALLGDRIRLTDHFLEEWFWRPAAIASYSAGRFSGVRAALAWHGTLSEMGMVVISSSIAAGPISQTLSEDAKPTGEGGKALAHAFPRFADDLAWWMEAAKAQRERKEPPY